MKLGGFLKMASVAISDLAKTVMWSDQLQKPLHPSPSYFYLNSPHPHFASLMPQFKGPISSLPTVFVLFSLLLLHAHAALPLPSSPVTHIAFGSCNAHNRDQSIWKSIVDAKPDIFVWLGDVVYADTSIFPLIWTATPIEKMQGKLEAQKNSALYSQLRESTPIVGVWVRGKFLFFRVTFTFHNSNSDSFSILIFLHKG